jgi:hypothetical protein
VPRSSARPVRALRPLAAARVPPRPDPVLSAEELGRLEELVGTWLTVPQLAERLDLPLVKARQLLAERQVLAVRRGPNSALYVPEAFVSDGILVKGLAGALSVLADAGFDDVAAVRWLFTPDDTLPGTPVEALAGNRGTEVKRRAQALAF